MKKKHTANSDAPNPEAVQPKDYVVGLVSDSLCSSQTSTANSALSSLFSLTSPYSKAAFVPAPKVEQKTSCKKETSGVLSSGGSLKDIKSKKEKSLAEKKLEDREGALQNADDEDVQKSKKKVKRKALKTDDEDLLEEERAAKRQKTTWNKAEERIKLKRTVFVGNLPVSCKKKDLKKIFKDLGEIESVRFRSVLREDPTMSRRLATIRRQIDPKKPSINAYVVFNDQEGAKNALQRNRMEIQKDVIIRVDRVSQHGSHDHKRSVFIGNLSYDVTELQFRQHFEECGNVEAVRLVRDRNTGVGKGFGYVLFESTDAVMLALKLNNSELLGRKIRVKRSVKKEKVKDDRRSAGRGGQGRGGRDAGNRRGPKSGNFRAAEGSKSTGKSFQKRPGVGNKTSSDFKGKMSDPNSKKSKGLKKKFKPRKSKTVHI
ncbi:RNA-binding protein 34 [Trichomycterus rosablanca]|uniref:RNA-binding protein 34 n=1 Tax=Trichomycterus rosablanca TaxID=2290929 RepID=UPI002F35165B